jgi:hypothetical protein
MTEGRQGLDHNREGGQKVISEQRVVMVWLVCTNTQGIMSVRCFWVMVEIMTS